MLDIRNPKMLKQLTAVRFLRCLAATATIMAMLYVCVRILWGLAMMAWELLMFLCYVCQ